jgi:ethanolamine utilization protein EutN
MLICKVVKPLVSTNRIPDFEHKHLQVVLDGSTQKVAVDAVGCIPGDWVICVGSSAAREAAGSKSYPSDLTIVGIIDHWDPDAGKAPVKSETSASTDSPSKSESAPKTEIAPSSLPAAPNTAAQSPAPGSNGGGKI